MAPVRIAGLWLLGLVCPAAFAETTTSVVDLDFGIPVRILQVRPDAPRAHLVSFAGRDAGFFGIESDGTIPTFNGRCSPIARNRLPFAGQGFAVTLVNALYSPALVRQVIDVLRARDPVPVWIAGETAQIDYVAGLAVNLPADLPLGMVFSAPFFYDAALVAQIPRPSLVVHNVLDGQHPTVGQALLNALAAAPIKEIAALNGGTNVNCTYTLYQDLDAPFVAAIGTFIDKHNATLGNGAPSVATAVEYYNAGLDHYFLTHVAAEIALLDAGTTIKGWVRTGQSFDVYTAPKAGSSPVCRYYIPPGKGDSHFYGRGTAECNATGAANPSFVNEDPQFFHVELPAAGVCAAGTRNVYRTFSNRADANHRYMVDGAIRDQMVGKGWLAEGDGPNLVVMCVPA